MSSITALNPGLDEAKYAALPHVLLIVDQFPKTLGGGERIVLRLAALLPQYGYRASILTFAAHPESAGLKSLPCPAYLLPLQKTYDLAALRAALDLRRFLEQQRVRVVMTFFESSDIWGGLVTKALSEAKLVWNRRDMGILRGRKHHVAYRLMAGMPDRVFAVSEQVRRYSIEVDGIDPARVETVYNGLDLGAWGAEPRALRPSNEFVVATVGNIRRVKGHDVLIRAAAMVTARFPGVTFQVAGDVLEPEYFAELQELVRELGLTERFHFVGGVTNLPEFLAGADLFVLPSRSEGFSNAIVEAMAASLPVAATDVGGNAEAVEDGVSGYIVPSEDAAALGEAILRLVSDPARARIMGEAGKARVAERFTTEAMMRRVSGGFDELLAGMILRD